MYFDQKEFGKRIRALRCEQGVTQEVLAEKLNTTRAHVSHIEAGTKACSIDLLIEVATVLNTSTDFLLMGREESENTKQNELINALEKALCIAKDLKM